MTAPLRRPLRATLARWAKGGAIALGASYLLVLGAACTFQRNLLYFPDPAEVAPPSSGPVQAIRLTADGERLVGWWLPPKPGRPAIIFFGGNGDSLIGEAARFEACAKEGVGLLAVAYEGYSGSSGHPSEAALHRDAEAAYAWLAAREPPSQIVIEGYSLGTGVAVRLAAQHSARALVLEAPYTAVVDVAADKVPWLPVRLLYWDRFASRDWIAKVHMPLLIVHGDADATIPQHFGRELFALANQPKQFVSVPGAGHVSLIGDKLYPRIWSFLGLAPLQPSSPAPT